MPDIVFGVDDSQSRYLQHRKLLYTFPFHTFSFLTSLLMSTCAMLGTVKMKGLNIEMCFITVGRAEGNTLPGFGQV